jgi:hypothetical protein
VCVTPSHPWHSSPHCFDIARHVAMSSPELTPEELDYYASLDLADPDDDALKVFLEKSPPPSRHDAAASPATGAGGTPPLRKSKQSSLSSCFSSPVKGTAAASPDVASRFRLSTSALTHDVTAPLRRPTSAGASSAPAPASGRASRYGVMDVLDKTDLIGGVVAMADAALQTRIVELPGRQLSSIDSVQCFLSATHLYLQYNVISSLEGLELLSQLQVLVIHHNTLSSVAPLHSLEHLFFLNLSFNKLPALPLLLERELPCSSLQYLNLVGNPCQTAAASASPAEHDTYVAAVRAACPLLEYLDDVRLTNDSDDVEERGEGVTGPTTANGEGGSISSRSGRRVHETVGAARVAALTGQTKNWSLDSATRSSRSFPDASTVDGRGGVSNANHCSEVQPPSSPARSLRMSKHSTPLEQEEERLIRQLMLLRSPAEADATASIASQSSLNGADAARGASSAVDGAVVQHDGLETQNDVVDALQLFHGLQYTQEVNQARQQRDVDAHWDDVSRVIQTAQGLQQERRRRMHERLQEATPSYAATLQLLQRESYTTDLNRYRGLEGQRAPPRPPAPISVSPVPTPASASAPAIETQPHDPPATPSMPGPHKGPAKKKRNCGLKGGATQSTHLPEPTPPAQGR